MRRTILHTGSSSGIGLESLKNLLDKCIIISLSRRKPPVEHANLTHYPMDFSNPCKSTLKKIATSHPDISALILCHGMGHFGKLENLSFEQMEEVMNTNFFSYVTLIKTFLPKLKQKEYARIIAIGSSSAIHGGREGSIYCASKFALRGFLESLQEECAKSPISISQIHPGMVRTPFFEKLHFGPGTNTFEAIDPKDIAPIIENALFSRDGTIISDVRIKAIHRVIEKQKKR